MKKEEFTRQLFLGRGYELISAIETDLQGAKVVLNHESSLLGIDLQKVEFELGVESVYPRINLQNHVFKLFPFSLPAQDPSHETSLWEDNSDAITIVEQFIAPGERIRTNTLLKGLCEAPYGWSPAKAKSLVYESFGTGKLIVSHNTIVKRSVLTEKNWSREECREIAKMLYVRRDVLPLAYSRDKLKFAITYFNGSQCLNNLRTTALRSWLAIANAVLVGYSRLATAAIEFPPELSQIEQLLAEFAWSNCSQCESFLGDQSVCDWPDNLTASAGWRKSHEEVRSEILKLLDSFEERLPPTTRKSLDEFRTELNNTKCVIDVSFLLDTLFPSLTSFNLEANNVQPQFTIPGLTVDGYQKLDSYRKAHAGQIKGGLLEAILRGTRNPKRLKSLYEDLSGKGESGAFYSAWKKGLAKDLSEMGILLHKDSKTKEFFLTAKSGQASS